MLYPNSLSVCHEFYLCGVYMCGVYCTRLIMIGFAYQYLQELRMCDIAIALDLNTETCPFIFD